MVGDPVNNRDLKIIRRNSTVHIISDLHRSYDALQYPLIFWQGQDEYHINIKQQDPITGTFNNLYYLINKFGDFNFLLLIFITI